MKTRQPSFMQRIKVQVISGLILTGATSAAAFAWNSNNRLTRLETALVSLAADVHDIKQLLSDRSNASVSALQ